MEELKRVLKKVLQQKEYRGFFEIKKIMKK